MTVPQSQIELELKYLVRGRSELEAHGTYCQPSGRAEGCERGVRVPRRGERHREEGVM